MDGHSASRWDRAKWVAIFAALLCLISAIAPVIAHSDPEPPPISGGPPTAEESPPHGPDGEEVVAMLQGAKRKEEEREEELASPAAVEEREASRHAFVSLDAAEAEELLEAKFPEELEALNADPARALSDVHLDRPLGEGDAVVTNSFDGLRLFSARGYEKNQHHPEAPPFESTHGFCTTASARRGTRPGEIDMVLRCLAPRRSGVPSVSIEREATGSTQPLGIENFSHHPMVLGPGATRRAGACSRERGLALPPPGGNKFLPVQCWTRAKGRIVIRGHIWVEAATRCSAPVSIVTPVWAKNEFRTLYRKRPAGCIK